MPFFSVIIPTFNRSTKVKVAIESVLNQSFRDFELIVVNNGSTDNTYEILRKYNGKISVLNYNINQGVSGARNYGIQNAKGKYIALLDDDDSWLKNKLQESVDFINDNPQIKIHQSEEIWIRNGKRINQKKRHKMKSGDIFKESLELCLISPSSVVINKDIFKKYGNFDEKLQACEDYDLWLRITKDEKIGLINKQLIIKNGGHEDQLSRKFWGMDRFRIYSMIKLLQNSKDNISDIKLQQTVNTIIKKTEIMIIGATKRENHKLVEQLNNIINLISNKDYRQIDLEFLLQ